MGLYQHLNKLLSPYQSIVSERIICTQISDAKVSFLKAEKPLSATTARATLPSNLLPDLSEECR